MTTVVSASSQYSHIWVLPVTPQSQLKAQHGLSASRHSVFEPHLQWKLYFILLWRLERCPFFYASSSLHPTNIKMLPYARQYLTELGMRVNHRHFTRSVQTYSKCCLVLRSCLPCSVKYLKHLFRARDSHIETCLLLIHHSNVYNSLTTQPDEEACRHSQETRTHLGPTHLSKYWGCQAIELPLLLPWVHISRKSESTWGDTRTYPL